jgi:hypothetical protein
MNAQGSLPLALTRTRHVDTDSVATGVQTACGGERVVLSEGGLSAETLYS